MEAPLDCLGVLEQLAVQHRGTRLSCCLLGNGQAAPLTEDCSEGAASARDGVGETEGSSVDAGKAASPRASSGPSPPEQRATASAAEPQEAMRLVYRMPLAEVVGGFFSEVLSRTSGRASLHITPTGRQASRLRRSRGSPTRARRQACCKACMHACEGGVSAQTNKKLESAS